MLTVILKAEYEARQITDLREAIVRGCKRGDWVLTNGDIERLITNAEFRAEWKPVS